MTGTSKPNGTALTVDPHPRFDLSPNLFMQFMEPLGDTDSSVEAAWDFEHERWRDDVIRVTRELAPGLIRWPGGCLTSYYRWKEGVGARRKRRPMLNLCWNGVESNQVGTHEFIDFCGLVGAEPLMAVNFESDGRRHWARPAGGGVRSAGPTEAAEWVDYCNNPRNAIRRANGARKPFNVRLWQIGNETSYDKAGFDCETAAKRTLAFARAMRKADPRIELIGWGDSSWASRLLEVAGEDLQYVAFHHHFTSGLEHSPLNQDDYRTSPARTWKHLMHAYRSTESQIRKMRRQVAGHDVKLALTESHFALPGRNRCDVLATWAAGVANARILNVHHRNGDILKIATLADFCGTRWNVNAIMIPVPRAARKPAYMMPVARVMSLYRRHSGRKAVDVAAAPEGLDVTASRTGKRIFLHVVNTKRTKPVRAKLKIDGMKIVSGKVFEIADDPMREIHEYQPGAFSPTQHALPRRAAWTFPAASVSAVELTVA
jgi:alpha-L-arabinofuranosidase